jgi:peptidoglycan/xylan/chitin deacetylase (PgdA/CDA1 family)
MIKIIKKVIFKLYSLKKLFINPCQFDGVKILLYHDIDEFKFKEHMEFLISNYNVISLNEMVSKFELGESLQDTFVITFDDGIKENFKLLETFKSFNFIPTIFVTGHVNKNHGYWFNKFDQEELIQLLELSNKDRVKRYNLNTENNPNSEREALNAIELDQMNGFVDFQPHTMTHPSLIKCEDDEIEHEILSSCKMVEGITGYKSSSFAPPFGIFDDRVINVLREVDIKCCLTIKPGINYSKTDLYSLKRIGVPESCDLPEFIARIDGVWDKIRNISFFKRYSSFYNQYYE